MGFLQIYLRTDITLLVLKHHCLTLGWSWEINYVKVCPFFANFLDFENRCCYLNIIARKRKKTHMSFLHFYLRTDITLLVLKHHCLTLGWSWEKNYVKMCPFWQIS